MDLEQVEICLTDAGCSKEIISPIVQMCRAQDLSAALKMMKHDRCRLIDEWHESARKVDCIDYLIRQTEKEINGGKKQ
ncbi:MAG: hypothetical protein J6D36_05990 [Erysipelotrichaceae bacterium]|jgi:hypothetical protein|nr:hypothetical protein [Erysipelotrichaceae bacterium]